MELGSKNIISSTFHYTVMPLLALNNELKKTLTEFLMFRKLGSGYINCKAACCLFNYQFI